MNTPAAPAALVVTVKLKVDADNPVEVDTAIGYLDLWSSGNKTEYIYSEETPSELNCEVDVLEVDGKSIGIIEAAPVMP